MQLPTGYRTKRPFDKPRIPLPPGKSGPSELEELQEELLEELLLPLEELPEELELPLPEELDPLPLDELLPDDDEEELLLELLLLELSELLESSSSGALPEVFIRTSLKYP